MSESEKVQTQTVESKTAADYLDPTNEPEPSEETGLGTHFGSTFDPNMKKEAPKQPETAKSAKEKLATTSSTMTTAQLQQAATEGDPNNLMQTKR